MKMNFAHKALMSLAIAGASLFNVGCTEDEKPAAPVEPIVSQELNTVRLVRTAEGDLEMSLHPEKEGEDIITFTTAGGEPRYKVEFSENFRDALGTHPAGATKEAVGMSNPYEPIDVTFTDTKNDVTVYAYVVEAGRGSNNQVNTFWAVVGGYNGKDYNFKPFDGGLDPFFEMFEKAQAGTFTPLLKQPKP